MGNGLSFCGGGNSPSPPRSDHDLLITCNGKGQKIFETTETSTDGYNIKSNAPPIRIPRYHTVLSRPSGHLLALAWSRDWPSVARRCVSHPREACAANDRGRTALHLVMFAGAPPVEVVLALLGANKHAVVVRDGAGSTPLHYACRFGCGDNPGGSGGGGEEVVVKILCHAVIDVERSIVAQADAASGSAQNSPFHMHGRVMIAPSIAGGSGATTLGNGGDAEADVPASPLLLVSKRNASLGTVRALIDASSFGAQGGKSVIASWIAPLTGAEPWYCNHRRLCWGQELKGNISVFPSNNDARSRSPLRALLGHFPTDEKGKILVEGSFCLEKDEEGESAELDASIVMPDLWQKILLLLQSGKSRSLPPTDDKAATGSSQGASYISSTAPKLHLHPLHAAAALATPLPELVELALLLQLDDVLKRDEFGMVPIHHAIMASIPNDDSQDGSTLVLKALLSVCPSAAELPSCDGRLPLTMAIERGMDWLALDLIIQASPETLYAKDVTTGLFPFMIAAAFNATVDIVYRLIRACPQSCKMQLGHNMRLP